MKKYLILVFSLCMAFALSSCSDDEVETVGPSVEGNEGNGEGEDNPEPPEVTNESILIVYFSRAGENYGVGTVAVGNTAIMAGYIQEYTGGTIFEIVPTVPYPNDYDEMRTVSQQETAANARPAFNGTIENWDEYSVVFVGAPIWYSTPPMIMRTFYETYREQLAGKTLIPFGTHAGSGVSSCTGLVREYFPNATLLETFGVSGASIRSESAHSDVENWLSRIGISRHE